MVTARPLSRPLLSKDFGRLLVPTHLVGAITRIVVLPPHLEFVGSPLLLEPCLPPVCRFSIVPYSYMADRFRPGARKHS